MGPTRGLDFLAQALMLVSPLAVTLVRCLKVESAEEPTHFLDGSSAEKPMRLAAWMKMESCIPEAYQVQ